jgi:hypothetical protein
MDELAPARPDPAPTVCGLSCATTTKRGRFVVQQSDQRVPVTSSTRRRAAGGIPAQWCASCLCTRRLWSRAWSRALAHSRDLRAVQATVGHR